MHATVRRPRVVVTRAQAQSSALADHLRALGAEPLLLPLIAIAAPANWGPLDAALLQMQSFDWLVLTSSNAVEAALNRCMQLGVSMPAQLSGVRTAVIGHATAAALAATDIAPELIARSPVAESLAEDLRPYVATSGRPTRFLLIRAEDARDVLPDALRAAGADVTVVAAYRNMIPPEAVTRAHLLFAGQTPFPDAITFTSSSSVRHLFQVLRREELSLARSIVRASIGPVTSATLEEFGFAADVEAATATVRSLAEVVMQRLQAKTGPLR